MAATQKSPDERVDQKAARQWGALAGSQAREAGLTQRQIDYRVGKKRWRRAAQDVYVLGGTADTWQQRAMVACLAGPPGTVASHLTAAALYGLVKPPALPHVTIPLKASGRRLRGATVFRTNLGGGEKALKERIPCTTPIRTVTDCSEVLDPEALCDMVDSALCRKLMQPSRLIKAAEAAWPSARRARRAGLGRLLEALVVWRSGAPPRCWVADDERLDRVEEETGWRMVPVDRFDLRPSNNNLRDRLEKLRPPDWRPLAA